MRCVASVFLLLAACSACMGAVGATIPFSTLLKGNNAGVREPGQVVVRSQSEWTGLWDRVMRSRATPPPPPPIDFSTEMVIAVFLGERPTGGYEIEVTQVEKIDTGLAVRYRVARPAPGAILMQVLTQPFHLIKLRRVDEPVMFSAETSAR